MTAAEAYDLTTRGGATDFIRLIQTCESFGEYCVVGGLAVNCYVEPVYTLTADLVVAAADISDLAARLQGLGFRTEQHPKTVNAFTAGSELRVQFTRDERYQAFLMRAVEAEILGVRVKVAALEDLAQGKLWAYLDPRRRLSKRKKDELDLIRLAEAYPFLKNMYPRELVEMIEGG